MNGRLITLQNAGASDFSVMGERTMPYSSYYIDEKNNYHPYEVSPEAHQAVLNEIAARPSNFGYGLGHALLRMFQYLKTQFNKIMPDEHTADTSESAAEQKNIIAGIKHCMSSTADLQQRLMDLEKAEENNYDCLVQANTPPEQARTILRDQRPVAWQSFSTLFHSVWAGPYKIRQELCQEEAKQSIQLAQEAEVAESKQLNACALR